MQIKRQLALFLTATTFLLACSKENKDNSTASSEVSISKLPVDAVKVKLEPLTQELTLAGSILPSREVIITAELSKKVSEIYFEDGSFVKQGQQLYKLDDADIVAKHKQLKSEIQLAQLNESRLSELLKSHSVVQEEYDIAYTKLQSLLANEELLSSELDKTIIKAPFAGRVGITKVHVGALSNPGTEFVKLQDQEKIRIQFAVPEGSIHSIGIGKEIVFSISGNDNKFTAFIVATEPGFDNQTRSITVHALAENPKGLIKPGMSAKVFLKTMENHNGVTLPSEALIPGANGYNVFTVKKGLAQITPVTVSKRNERLAIITAGINNGDTIMVSNMLRAGAGVPVELVTLN